VTRRRHGASFLSNGRYHHHLAGNVWHSAGAGMRDPDRAGLAWFSFEANDATTLEREIDRLRQAGVPLHDVDGGLEVLDPWGTRVRFVPA
jgi:catechol 2,3-dioxygenase